jgi:ribosomal protein L12E/L44/L45/RPP1/RPP2
LLVTGGNATPSKEDVSAVISSIGGEVDEAKLDVLFGDLEGKDINELLASGETAIKGISMGGGGAPAAASSGSGGAAAPAPKAAEKPKVEEVDALDGGMDMFGGSGGGGSY